MKCKYCGADLLDATSFCVKCGKNNANETNDGEQIQQVAEGEQINKVSAGKKKKGIGAVLIAIITIAVLIAAIFLIVICLPPSEKKVRSDALEYAGIGDEYDISDITVSQKSEDGGKILADVQIEAVNKGNNDINNINLSIVYFRYGLKYDKNLTGEIETEIYPDHQPDQKDVFPLPEIILECRDLGESAVYSATDDEIAIDIDYENIVINEKTAEVPINVHADLPTAEGEGSIIAQYVYEGDCVWSGKNAVSIDMQPKYTISEDCINDSIKSINYTYEGYIIEELDGAIMQPGDFSVRYYDMYSRAEVTSSFTWLNDYVRLEGELSISFHYENDDWVAFGGRINKDNVSAEWFYYFDEEMLAEQLPDIIMSNCTETEGMRNIEIVDKDVRNGKLIYFVHYNTVHQPFMFTNEIELHYYSTIFQGYQSGGIKEVSTDYAGISGDYDTDVTVNYSLVLSGTTPNGMDRNGKANLHLHFDASGNVHLSGKIGTIPVDNNGTIEYPSGILSMSTCEKDIYVNYVLILRSDYYIPYRITPSLTYHDGTLSGSIYCDSISIGVDDILINIE